MSQTKDQIQSQKISRQGRKCLKKVIDEDSFSVISSRRKNKGNFWGKSRCYFAAIEGGEGFPRGGSGCSWTLQAAVDELMRTIILLKADF